jgi:hypothetical protein
VSEQGLNRACLPKHQVAHVRGLATLLWALLQQGFYDSADGPGGRWVCSRVKCLASIQVIMEVRQVKFMWTECSPQRSWGPNGGNYWASMARRVLVGMYSLETSLNPCLPQRWIPPFPGWPGPQSDTYFLWLSNGYTLVLRTQNGFCSETQPPHIPSLKMRPS